MKKRCSAMAAALCAATAFAADPIVRQERVGRQLVVGYASGRIETNGLFLAMSPQVKQAVARAEASRTLGRALASVIADTRESIPETAALSDVEVAGLYLAQMRKPADRLATAARTNTLEYLVGAGMRIDLGAIPEPGDPVGVPDGVKGAGLLAAGAAIGAGLRGKKKEATA
jgi:hypothetical protein